MDYSHTTHPFLNVTQLKVLQHQSDVQNYTTDTTTFKHKCLVLHSFPVLLTFLQFCGMMVQNMKQ
jgi:hypothetical protein